MTDATACHVPISCRLSFYDSGRWLVIAGMVVFDLIGFRLADIPPDWESAEASGELLLLFLSYGLALDQVRRRTGRFRVAQKLAAFGADLCLSAVQLALFALVSAPLTYIFARFDMPLVDSQLQASDHLLGFDWTTVSDWVTAHHPVFAVLRWAYFSHIEQSWILIALGSLWMPGRRNGEFIWTFMISLTICCAGFAVAPALAMGGATGYVPVLKSLRAGEPMMFDWGHLEGLVAFPSFHAALGTIYIYAARHRLWALIPFVILDAMMIAATPPMGGHYLTDTIAGIGVALISIGLTRRLQPASPSASDSRLALPPAAVVSTEITRSTANRAR